MTPTIINLKCVPAGVELILAGLGKMPYEQSAPLIAELHQQYQAEMKARIEESKAD